MKRITGRAEHRSGFLRILNLIEDYWRYGFRQIHADRPAVQNSLAAQLSQIAGQIRGCRQCQLHGRRTQAVPGEGSLQPELMVIGEGPGADEDRTGRPFVGRAGQYLDKWLGAIGLDRSRNCFITNVVKCRPPGNRDPEPEEVKACLPYLKAQISLLRPKAILTVGRIATQILLDNTSGIGALRGKVHAYARHSDGEHSDAQHSDAPIPLVATYHPSAVLRDSSLRGAVWEDLKLLRDHLKGGPTRGPG